MKFILIIIILWGLWKLSRWWLMRKLNNRARDFFDQFSRQAGFNPDGQPSNPPRRSSTGWDTPQKKKKIDRSEGEYVDYEEITAVHSETTIEIDPEARTTQTRTTTTSFSEERITDAEWEDL